MTSWGDKSVLEKPHPQNRKRPLIPLADRNQCSQYEARPKRWIKSSCVSAELSQLLYLLSAGFRTVSRRSAALQINVAWSSNLFKQISAVSLWSGVSGFARPDLWVKSSSAQNPRLLFCLLPPPGLIESTNKVCLWKSHLWAGKGAKVKYASRIQSNGIRVGVWPLTSAVVRNSRSPNKWVLIEFKTRIWDVWIQTFKH